ncbi:MAG: DUF6931 family protein [Methylocella sp.]
MQRLRFATAKDLFAAFPTAAKDVGAPATSEAPLDYMNNLAKTGQAMAALSFCAYLLDRRQATCWACRCVRGLPGTPASGEIRTLAAAEAWVEQPNEPRRLAAHKAALAGDHTSPATFAAYAAAYSGPSLRPAILGPDDGLVVRIPPYLTAQSTRAAFLLAGPRLPAKKKDDYRRIWLDEGIRLINGK